MSLDCRLLGRDVIFVLHCESGFSEVVMLVSLINNKNKKKML